MFKAILVCLFGGFLLLTSLYSSWLLFLELNEVGQIHGSKNSSSTFSFSFLTLFPTAWPDSSRVCELSSPQVLP